MSVVNIPSRRRRQVLPLPHALLQTKIEGKGNGIKTVIPNMSDIARSLSRPPAYPTKFFGCELGAQVSADDKTDRYIVNGAHDADRLRELLDGFIDKFVLCGDCKNPETDLKILKDGDILRNCKACGKRTGVDMKHKLTTFIVKHPPPKRVKGAKGAGKSAGQDAGDGGSDDELTKRIKAEAAEIPTAEQRGNVDGRLVRRHLRGRRRRTRQGARGQRQVVARLGDDEEDEDEDSPYAQFGRWLVANRKGGEEGRECSAAEVYKKAQEFGIEKKHKTVQVLAQSLFTEDAPKEIERYGAVLAKMVGDSEKHQKAMLGGFERLAGVQYPALVPNGVPKILMALYQIDVLDEEFVKNWGTHVSKKYVDKDTSKKVRRAAAAPFLQWLDEADSDSDDDEDDSDDEAKPNGNGAKKSSEEEDDDSDLDNL